MSSIAKLSALTLVLVMAGCATTQAPSTQASDKPASQTPATAPATAGADAQEARIVKSKDGNFDGEVLGTPAPNSKFAKLKIGMTMREVNNLIGTPDDITRHETGKRWIPFYFGNDVQRMQTLYKSEGCLTYTAGNQFGGGGNELIRITVDAKGMCME